MSELATLRIYRPAERLASLGKIAIEMNGQELTRLRDGASWAGYVDPGRHILRGRWSAGFWSTPPKELMLMLKPGDNVRLEARVSAWTAEVSFFRTDCPPQDPLVAQPPEVAEVLGVTEGDRSAEPIGTDTHRVDNASGVGRVTRTIRITEAWSRMVSLNVREVDGKADGISGGLPWLSLKRSIERSLGRTYAISVDRREEFSQEMAVEIEPGAIATVILSWKRMWQHGEAHVLTQRGHVDVPYRMAVGITFDSAIQRTR